MPEAFLAGFSPALMLPDVMPQLGPFTAGSWQGPGWILLALAAINIIIVIILAFTIGHNRRPTTSVAWLLAITLIPYIGLCFFLLFGTNRLPASRRAKQARFDSIIREVMDELETVGQYAPVPGRFKRVSKLARTLTAIPHLPGNRIQIHTDYNATLNAMAAELDTAEQYAHVLFYAMGYDDSTREFFDALERAHARGVKVRLLYDQIGTCRYPGYRKMKRRLNDSGIEWRRLYPIWPWQGGWQRPDLRNHRKLLVVDSRVAWMGSQNLIDRGYHRGRARYGNIHQQWQDLMVRLDGPIALGVDAIFRSDWFAETNVIPQDGESLHSKLLDTDPDSAIAPPNDEANEGALTHLYDCQLVPSGPGYEHENNLRIFTQLLYQAKHRVVIASPYFVPDDSMLYAITTAVQRGVSVDLHVSAQGDQFFTHHAQQSYYEQLLRAGVRIWLYREPYVLHAKHMTVDGEVTLVGSSNMDMRSFTLNAEMMLIVYGREFTARMATVEQEYRENSTELSLVDWMSRPRWRRWIDDLCRLTSVVQ